MSTPTVTERIARREPVTRDDFADSPAPADADADRPPPAGPPRPPPPPVPPRGRAPTPPAGRPSARRASPSEPASHVEAAVDAPHLAGDVRRGVRGKEGHHAGDLLGTAHPAHRDRGL